MNDPIPFTHRQAGNVRPLSPEIAERFFAGPVDTIEVLRDRIYRRRSTFERVADALGSERFLTHFVAFTAGSLFTCGMALLWAVVGK